TKPKSMSSPSAPTLTGARLWARTSPASTPLMPTASMLRSRHRPSTRVLIRPLSTIAVTSIERWSVTRRPSTMRVGTHPAPRLHHEGLALVHADVGRGAPEGADGESLIASMHDHEGLFAYF